MSATSKPIPYHQASPIRNNQHMKSLKLGFKHTSQVFEATSQDGKTWNITKPAHSTGNFDHVAGQVSLLVRKNIPEVVKFLAQEDCQLSSLSFCRKFATFECEPQELREGLLSTIKEIIAYNVTVTPVVEVEAAEETEAA
jgi:hypothetical protein